MQSSSETQIQKHSKLNELSDFASEHPATFAFWTNFAFNLIYLYTWILLYDDPPAWTGGQGVLMLAGFVAPFISYGFSLLLDITMEKYATPPYRNNGYYTTVTLSVVLFIALGLFFIL